MNRSHAYLSVLLAIIIVFFSIAKTHADNRVVVIPLGGETGQNSFADFDEVNLLATITVSDAVISSVTLTAPTAGVVIANSSLIAVESTAGGSVRCSLSLNTTTDLDYLQQWISAGSPSTRSSLSGTRGINVSMGQTLTVYLVCHHTGSSASSEVRNATLTAAFHPNNT